MSRCPREPSSRIRLPARSECWNRLSFLGSRRFARPRSAARFWGVCVALALGVGPKEARGAEPEPASGPVTPPVELRHDLRIDGAVTAGLAASVVTAMLIRDGLQPGQCRWCDGSKPSDLNGLDDWFRTGLRRPDPGPANLSSHILAFGMAPLATGGLTVLAAAVDRRSSETLTDLVLVAEGTFSAIVTTEVLKPIIVRTRPFAHAIADEDARREVVAGNPDAIRSFPSGHTTAVFGMTASAGMIASLRGYRLAPLVWATGIMFGVATAYARIAADKHYFTDTLGGAAIGLVVGGGVPYLFHRPTAGQESASMRWLRRASIATAPVPGGRIVSVGWEL